MTFGWRRRQQAEAKPQSKVLRPILVVTALFAVVTALAFSVDPRTWFSRDSPAPARAASATAGPAPLLAQTSPQAVVPPLPPMRAGRAAVSANDSEARRA